MMRSNRSTIRRDVARVSIVVKGESEPKDDVLDEMDAAVPSTSSNSTDNTDAPTVDPHCTDARLRRFVFSHALANSVKVIQTHQNTSLQIGVLESLLTKYAIDGEQSLMAVNDALVDGRLLLDSKGTLSALANFTAIR